MGISGSLRYRQWRQSDRIKPLALWDAYVNGELKRLIADLDSDSSGGGTVLFEPALRASPADATPVVFRNPMGKFLLAEDSVSYGTRPGIISDIELSLVEDIT